MVSNFLILLSAIDRILFRSLKIIAGILFSAMLVVIFIGVLLRELFDLLGPWLGDITLYYLLTWYVFLSAAILARNASNISVELFRYFFTERILYFLDLIISFFCIILCGYLSWISIDFTVMAFVQEQTTESGYLPIWIGYLSIPVGLGLTAIACFFYSLERLLR